MQRKRHPCPVQKQPSALSVGPAGSMCLPKRGNGRTHDESGRRDWGVTNPVIIHSRLPGWWSDLTQMYQIPGWTREICVQDKVADTLGASRRPMGGRAFLHPATHCVWENSSSFPFSLSSLLLLSARARSRLAVFNFNFNLNFTLILYLTARCVDGSPFAESWWLPIDGCEI